MLHLLRHARRHDTAVVAPRARRAGHETGPAEGTHRGRAERGARGADRTPAGGPALVGGQGVRLLPALWHRDAVHRVHFRLRHVGRVQGSEEEVLLCGEEKSDDSCRKGEGQSSAERVQKQNVPDMPGTIRPDSEQRRRRGCRHSVMRRKIYRKAKNQTRRQPRHPPGGHRRRAHQNAAMRPHLRQHVLEHVGGLGTRQPDDMPRVPSGRGTAQEGIDGRGPKK
mmetsp:Transcript_33925/g.72326  ORF Transcript_33925/g.72326 Transcript_33925/m.72326 type:complete len:224 (+) Transcript_33925:788-1459(+)